MANSYGKAFAIPGTTPKLAPGTSHDAGVRSFRNVFNLSTDTDKAGGTSNALKIADLREGMCVTGLHLAADVALGLVNFTCGTIANPTKYAVAFAGPAANAQVVPPVVIAMQAMDPLAAPEEVFLFPSAALPAAGVVVARVTATKR